MSVFTALYNLLIGPLELIFEVIFAMANRIINHPGLSIIFLSLAMNFLVLPLYKRADAMQAEERDTEMKLQHWVTHIKKTFKGDERFMMLQTYYRQNHYKPTDALKGSMSLLLEIPFFIAAYNFLSELKLLHGVSFGPIHDLGEPDGMLVIAGIAINVLPILMTAINIISGAIYTKGFSMKSKVQLYAMALIFLVFLYDSPSGLVFYWTLNNLFSLFKNVFYKLKNPKFVLCVVSSVVSAALMAVVLFVHPMANMHGQIMVLLFLLLLQLPLVFYFVGKRAKTERKIEITKKDKITFFGGSLFITILTGALIPSTVIKDSPQEFINMITYTNPLLFVLNSLLLAAGIFIIWFGIFYMLASPSGKKVMGFAMWGLSGIAVIDYMFFGKGYGNLSSSLKFDLHPAFPVDQQIINLLVLLVAVSILYIVWKKKDEIVRVVYLAAGLAAIGMSVVNTTGIQSAFSKTVEGLQTSEQENVASIPLSKNGKNVMVIMMDRAINAYIPYIFAEKPEVKEQFAGFTYYPNTISYGAYTNMGSPALYGGYDYTPEKMNQRADESLESKHNEALKVMPVIFDEQGYEVTVCDPTYAGYDWIPDLSIYDAYPDINKYILKGKFNDFSKEKLAAMESTLNRNFFCYSIFKIAPVFIQPNIYNAGTYNEPDVDVGQVRTGNSKSTGMSDSFMQPYAVLENLPRITNVTDDAQNTFMMMSNDTTHDPMLLKEPEYEPADSVDNTKYDADHTDRFTLDGRTMRMENSNQIIHYQANVASMIQLGRWFDYLRENDVYDNTRIIIVADHGKDLKQFDDMCFGEDGELDVMSYNPLLMVKDFDSKEFTTDHTFMTNGDVPTFATDGLIDNPVNPFTGNPINSDTKLEPEQHILCSDQWRTSVNNGNTFLPDDWVAVKDNIFDENNWRAIK